MKNIIFFFGGGGRGGIGDRDWTIMVLFHVVQEVNARDLLNDEFKAKKLSHWNINIMVTQPII